MATEAKSIEELFPLIEFCKAGNLSAVSKWIAEGNPINPPPGKKTRRASPLQIAIEKGFLTLTEVLLDAGANPAPENSSINALWYAVERKRADIAALLLDRGMPIDSVDFGSVCYSGDPTLINLFLERGADPKESYPLYYGMRHCLNPLLGIYKTQREKHTELQIQADMALCHYAREGNLRCVSLLIWAGARPDFEIPEDEGGRNDFRYTCAFEQAAYGGHTNILKRMKPENYPAIIPRLLEICSSREGDCLEFALSLISKISALPDEGLSVLSSLFWNLGWAADPKQIFGVRSPAKIDRHIDALEALVKQGLKWKPSPESARDMRRHIRHLEPEKILRVFRILKDHDAAEIPFLESLVATPTMRAHLWDHAKKITDLFHPPPSKPAKASTETIPTEKKREEDAPATIPELKARAETYIVDTIRNTTCFCFWSTAIQDHLDSTTARRILGMKKDDERSYYRIIQEAAQTVNKQAKTYEVTIQGNDYNDTISGITITRLKGKEWTDVQDEVWKNGPSTNPRRISDPSIKLFAWLKEQPPSEDWLSETSISWKIGFKGKQGLVGGLLRELQRKLAPYFHFEEQGSRWDRKNPISYLIRIDPEASIETPATPKTIPSSLNPVFKHHLHRITKEDLDEWTDLIYDHLLKATPSGLEPVYVYWVDTAQELARVFPALSPSGHSSGGSKLTEFFESLRIIPEIVMECDFKGSINAWYLRIIPQESWKASLKAIEDLRSQPTLQALYDLSNDSAKLLAWIESLDDEERLEEWTPIVEDAQEERIGLECPWNDDDNFPAYIQLLIDEINDKTPYDLKLQPWKDYSDWKTRIRVRKKESEESKIIQQIQLYGLQKGKLLEEQRVRELLTQLLDPKST
jgi:hypothetical protein